MTGDAVTTAIRFDAVTVRFGAVTALDAITIAIAGGDLCALCGPNGAGKSTAMQLIAGLLRPTSGQGEVLGEALAARPARRRARIGHMAQHTVLYDELTVVENLRFRAAAMGLAQHRACADAALQTHQLDGVRSQRVGRLSGGWRQRVAFCSALLAQPQLLLLDEPTAGLDAASRGELWRAVRGLAASGVTVIVSTHDIAEAASCDALVVLDRGRLVFAGTPAARWPAPELAALRAAAAIGLRAA